MNFHALEPNWAAIGFDETMGELPAVKWKALNLEQLRDQNRAKFDEQLELLAVCLGKWPLGAHRIRSSSQRIRSG